MTNSDNNNYFAGDHIIADLTKITDLMQKDVAGRIKAMNEKMKHFSSHVICDNALADLREEIDMLKGNIEGGKRIVADLRQELAEQKENVEAWRGQNFELSAENRDLHEQVQVMTNTISQLRAVVDDLKQPEKGSAMDDFLNAAAKGLAGN